jgi:hypothetical protein
MAHGQFTHDASSGRQSSNGIQSFIASAEVNLTAILKLW